MITVQDLHEVVLPPNMIVRDTLQDLLGRDIELSPTDPWAPALRDPGAVAVYVNDGFRASALVACSLELAAALAASIALIPAAVAEESVQEGRLSADLAENLFEVLNVLAGLFNRQHAPHVKLHEVYPPGKPAPVEVAGRLRMLGERSDLAISVHGYGSGRLSIVVS